MAGSLAAFLGAAAAWVTVVLVFAGIGLGLAMTWRTWGSRLPGSERIVALLQGQGQPLVAPHDEEAAEVETAWEHDGPIEVAMVTERHTPTGPRVRAPSQAPPVAAAAPVLGTGPPVATRSPAEAPQHDWLADHRNAGWDVVETDDLLPVAGASRPEVDAGDVTDAWSAAWTADPSRPAATETEQAWYAPADDPAQVQDPDEGLWREAPEAGPSPSRLGPLVPTRSTSPVHPAPLRDGHPNDAAFDGFDDPAVDPVRGTRVIRIKPATTLTAEADEVVEIELDAPWAMDGPTSDGAPFAAAPPAHPGSSQNGAHDPFAAYPPRNDSAPSAEDNPFAARPKTLDAVDRLLAEASMHPVAPPFASPGPADPMAEVPTQPHAPSAARPQDAWHAPIVPKERPDASRAPPQAPASVPVRRPGPAPVAPDLRPDPAPVVDELAPTVAAPEHEVPLVQHAAAPDARAAPPERTTVFVPPSARERTLSRTEALEELSAIYGISYEDACSLLDVGLWGFENHEEWIRAVRAGGHPEGVSEEVFAKVLGMPMKAIQEDLDKLRKKREATQELEKMWGVGATEASALYDAGFTDMAEIREASVDQLARIPGITHSIAFMIKASAHGLAPDHH